MNAIVRTSRLVIENQLLTALENKKCVTALLTKEDLQVLIVALGGYDGPDQKRGKSLREGFSDLNRAAFP